MSLVLIVFFQFSVCLFVCLLLLLLVLYKIIVEPHLFRPRRCDHLNQPGDTF